MIRQILASLIDATGTAALAYVGFRVALAVAPCGNPGECVILTPMILLSIAVAVGAYFAVGWGRYRSTFARHLLAADDTDLRVR